MYKFTDTTGSSESSNIGSEGFSINGTYLEDYVPGYRTLYVTGRDLLEQEIDEYEIGDASGSNYRSKRYLPRTITVGYQLITDSPEAFREAYNKLSRALDAEQAKLVFADEPDKYFIGTKTSHTDGSSGRNCVTGEIEFYCADPFKYSTAETGFTATANDDGVMELTIVNNGSVPVPIDYTITHNAENGFVGIASSEGVLQFGDIDEEDTAEGKKSEKLLDYECKTTGTDFEQMTAGSGVHQTKADIKVNGTWKTIGVDAGRWSGEMDQVKVLTMASAGTSNAWNAAIRTVAIPADSNGDSGSTYWKVDYSVWWELRYFDDVGSLGMCIGDENGKYIAEIDIYKTCRTDNKAIIAVIAGDGQSKKVEFWPAKAPIYPNENIRLQKSGKTLSMIFRGKTYSVTSSAIANKKATTVNIIHYAYRKNGIKALPGSMYFYKLKFYKNNVTYYYDVPNRYQKGDVIRIDGKEAKVYLNGENSVADEVIGSQYFKAPPGETKVQFYFSTWCETKPTIQANIREAYI